MARWRERVRLEDGLKLDLNKLIRDGCGKTGEKRDRPTCWRRVSSGEIIVSGSIEMDLIDAPFGWATLRLGKLEQRIRMRGEARRFGGVQWYFLCPATGRRVSVAWLVPGASRFLSRKAFGRRVAYGSQFQTWRDRALSLAQDIRYRLGGKDFLSVIDGSTPPKPKGMHWRTYDKLIARSEAYERQCISYHSGFIDRLQRRLKIK
jgi:hypothetical protein